MQPFASVSHRRLGNSDCKLTPIGLGAWAIGGGEWEYSLGPQDDRESIAAIHCALDLGINWIDTAAVYGLGHSEEVLAKAIKSSPHKPYVFTKGSVRWRKDGSLYSSLKAASLAGEVDDSLRRLRVEAIDLFQAHWPVPSEEIEEGWEALARLREQGKIRWIGVSNFSAEEMARALKIAPIASAQPHYSMLRRDAEKEVLPFAKANGIGVISYSPMGSGLLTGNMGTASIAALPKDDWQRRNGQFQKPLLTRNLRLVELLQEIGAGHRVSPGVVAVAWVLHHSDITGAIVGLRSVSEVEEIAPALEFRLSVEEYERIGQFLGSFGWHVGSVLRRLSPEFWRTAVRNSWKTFPQRKNGAVRPTAPKMNHRFVWKTRTNSSKRSAALSDSCWQESDQADQIHPV
jgi:aryl-alcohol dehydrogenase-like predicted oxidoreductase